MITFDTYEIFHGFRSIRPKSGCIIAKMIGENHLNLDGTLIRETLDTLEIVDLWSYIYYLWKNNSDIELFKQMNGVNENTLSAQNLVKTILDYLETKRSKFVKVQEYFESTKTTIKLLIDKNDLIAFLDYLSRDTIWHQIKIPILSNLYQQIMKQISKDTELIDTEKEELQSNNNKSPIVNVNPMVIVDGQNSIYYPEIGKDTNIVYRV